MIYDSITSVKKLMIAGLAKNTGKTVTLNALIKAAAYRSEALGITSIGRDGERFDAINQDIEKPRIRLPVGTLVANSIALLDRTPGSFRVLHQTPHRTPLGRIVIARMTKSCDVEISGPSSAAEICQVSDTMLEMGADRVFIDGAINRKAATSPFIADGVVLATGAILNHDMDEVVRETRDWVEKLCLQPVDNTQVLQLARTQQRDFALTAGGDLIRLTIGGSLMSENGALGNLLHHHPDLSYLVVQGALAESSVKQLLAVRRPRPLTCVVPHGSHLFLGDNSLAWYRKRGLEFRALHSIALKAITLNPVCPGGHRFNSDEFEKKLSTALPGIVVFNVLNQPKTQQGTPTLAPQAVPNP